MDKYYSYTDFLKALGQKTNVNDNEQLLNDIYLDLFINRLLRMHRIEQLQHLIDEALDKKDGNAFLNYTNELKELSNEDLMQPPNQI